MKRLISRGEAAQAGLLDRAGWPVVAAMMPLPFDEGGRYDLRRSLPGYRKACRMLRRSGRRIRSGPEIGVQAYRSVLDDPAAKAFGQRSVYALPDNDTLNQFARELCGPVPEPFVPTLGVYIDTYDALLEQYSVAVLAEADDEVMCALIAQKG